MRDHHHCWHAIEHASHRTLEVVGIELGEALVEEDAAGVLQQRAAEEQPAALPVRERSTGLPYLLRQTGGHSRQQIPEPELPTDLLRPP